MATIVQITPVGPEEKIVIQKVEVVGSVGAERELVIHDAGETVTLHDEQGEPILVTPYPGRKPGVALELVILNMVSAEI